MILNYLPMPHKVLIEKTAKELDSWGIPQTDVTHLPTENVARVSYNTKNEKLTLAEGKHISFTANILFEGVPNITYKDFICWTDSAGNTYRKKPLEIMYKHDLSGSPVAVKVVV